MKLDPKALAYAVAALWGGSMLLVGLVNLASPGYGQAFLRGMAGLYPGYTAEPTVSSVLIGTGYGLVDGAVGGWVVAWLYNRLVK